MHAVSVLKYRCSSRITLTTSEEQATGLERFELLGKLEGVDVFDMKALEMDRMGTMDDPIPIYSLVRSLLALPRTTLFIRSITRLDRL